MDKLAIKLTHVIDVDLVQAVEGGRVVLSVPAAEAAQEQKTIS